MALIAHAEMFANANRDPEKQRDPIRFPTPFPEPEAEAPATEAEIEEARAILRAHSMFADEA
ncbi:hypothetical protein [Microbacterium resistens]|uniref:hypothetical protein n=1 Tax=Microbacterium resistens TaxID=156977 RepID=UPI00366D6E7D